LLTQKQRLFLNRQLDAPDLAEETAPLRHSAGPLPRPFPMKQPVSPAPQRASTIVGAIVADFHLL
jgi:hypothetical protein